MFLSGLASDQDHLSGKKRHLETDQAALDVVALDSCALMARAARRSVRFEPNMFTDVVIADVFLALFLVLVSVVVLLVVLIAALVLVLALFFSFVFLFSFSLYCCPRSRCYCCCCCYCLWCS
jgi:hypothetical protein